MAASGNLDRTLDSIAKDRKVVRTNKPRRAAAAATAKTTAAIKGPSNGVQKARAAKPVKAVVPQKRGESKIQVSGLPDDVSDSMLKEYFSEAVAPVKKVLVNYGPNGRSRGSATVIFSDVNSAARALKDLDGVRVDNRTLRIEVLASSTDILSQIPAKALSDRITKPKTAAKEKTKTAPAGKGAAGKAKPEAKADGKTEGGRKKKAGRAGRPKAKTVDELDAEMADYFGGPTNGAAPANGAAQPAAAADTAMVDEVL